LLQPIFGNKLMFPPAFVGRGDMSRGGLMLRCVMAGLELDYTPVAGAVRHGQRPPKAGADCAAARRTKTHKGRFSARRTKGRRATKDTKGTKRTELITSVFLKP
jgi:hypothetical protein